MIVRTYKYWLKPNATAVKFLTDTLRTHCRVYNDALAWRIHAYEVYGRAGSISFNEQSEWYLKRRDSDHWMSRVNARSLLQTLRRLDKAYKAFFSRVKKGGPPGFPRFKSSDRFDTIHFGQENGYKVTPPAEGKWGKLRLTEMADDRQKIHHNVRIKFHRPIPAGAKQKQISVTREGERWYLAITLELPDSYAKPCGKGTVGVDVGLKTFAFDSDGNKHGDTRHLERALPELRRRQRAVSRKTNKRSNHRREAVQRVAALHRKIRNQRRDLANKTVAELVDGNAVIGVEDLNVAGMVKNPALARRIADAGWSGFLTQLAATAEQRGGRVVAVPAAGTTQECSGCGEVVPKDLSVRTHKCSSCGLEIDRDLNAAINIKNRAEKIIAGEDKSTRRKRRT